MALRAAMFIVSPSQNILRQGADRSGFSNAQSGGSGGSTLFRDPGVRLVFDVAASREQLVYEPDLGFVTRLGVIRGGLRVSSIWYWTGCSHSDQL